MIQFNVQPNFGMHFQEYKYKYKSYLLDVTSSCSLCYVFCYIPPWPNWSVWSTTNDISQQLHNIVTTKLDKEL